jgi:VRR-NUC domain
MPFIRWGGGWCHIKVAKRPRRRTKFMGLRWPATRKELYAAGYVREMTMASRPCKRCGIVIQFWRTPDKKLMPIEESKEDANELLCHFNTCPHAEEFRKPQEIKAKQARALSLSPPLLTLPMGRFFKEEMKKIEGVYLIPSRPNEPDLAIVPNAESDMRPVRGRKGCERNYREKHIKKWIESYGYKILQTGWPDFLCSRMLGGRKIFCFIEAKCDGDRVSQAQKTMHRALEQLGIPVSVVFSQDASLSGVRHISPQTRTDGVLLRTFKSNGRLRIPCVSGEFDGTGLA